jgi:CubicO group peptidase (beta-lactamase class C family)
MRHYGVPGVSVAVIDRFDIAWAEPWGVADVDTGAPVTVDTLFQVSSMSKPVAAAMALRLVQAGRLSLDTDVNAALRTWKVPESPFTREEPVTLARLLSHTAGLSVPGSPGYEPGEPRPTLLASLDGLPPANTRPVRADSEPRMFRYSGGGYMVLQQLLEDRTGKPFAVLARELVLDPLGLKRSSFAQPLPPELAAQAASAHGEDGRVLPGRWRVHVDLAAAGLWSTAPEYARFVAEIQRAAAGRRSALLKPEMARRLIAPVTHRSSLGMDLVRRGEVVYFGHGGANWGYHSLFLAHPRKGYGVVVLTNSDFGDGLAWEIARSVAREYGWESFLPAPLARAALSSEDLGRLAGRYQLDADDVLTVEVKGDRLLARPTLGEPFELLPVAGGAFARVDQPQEYSFTETGLKTRSSGHEWRSDRPRIVDGNQLPSERLESGDIEGALAAYQELRKRNPQDPALERLRLEERARALLKRGHAQSAAALLRFSLDLYPGFASTWDALAEALLAQGDTAGAKKASEEVLRTLETDFSPTASWRVVYRKNAEQRLGR